MRINISDLAKWLNLDNKFQKNRWKKGRIIWNIETIDRKQRWNKEHKWCILQKKRNNINGC